MMGIAFALSAAAYILYYPFGPGSIPRVEWTPLTNVTIDRTVSIFVHLFGFYKLLNLRSCSEYLTNKLYFMW